MEPIFHPSISQLCGPSNDKITYTWSDVNAYVTTRKERIWDRALFKSKRPLEQRHILKDGTNLKILKNAISLLI